MPQDGRETSHEPGEYRNGVGSYDGYAYDTDAADGFASVFQRVYFHLARWWPTEAQWDDMGDDGMVRNVSPFPLPRSLQEDPDCAVPEAFHINVEGKLTHPLWLFCALFATCMQSPETMSALADVVCSREDDPARQRVMEDVKRNMLDAQDCIDSARQITEGDREVSAPAPLRICSDVRDAAFDLESKPRDEADNLALAAATSALTRERSGALAALPSHLELNRPQNYLRHRPKRRSQAGCEVERSVWKKSGQRSAHGSPPWMFSVARMICRAIYMAGLRIARFLARIVSARGIRLLQSTSPPPVTIVHQ